MEIKFKRPIAAITALALLVTACGGSAGATQSAETPVYLPPPTLPSGTPTPEATATKSIVEEDLDAPYYCGPVERTVAEAVNEILRDMEKGGVSTQLALYAIAMHGMDGTPISDNLESVMTGNSTYQDFTYAPGKVVCISPNSAAAKIRLPAPPTRTPTPQGSIRPTINANVFRHAKSPTKAFS